MKTKKVRAASCSGYERPVRRYVRIPISDITADALDQIRTGPGQILGTNETHQLRQWLEEVVLAVAERVHPGHRTMPWPSRVEIAWGGERRAWAMAQHYMAAERLLEVVDTPR